MMMRQCKSKLPDVNWTTLRLKNFLSQFCDDDDSFLLLVLLLALRMSSPPLSTTLLGEDYQQAIQPGRFLLASYVTDGEGDEFFLD